jgi:PST family polysaccharide transporter
LLRLPGLDRAIVQLPTLEKDSLNTYFSLRIGIVLASSLLTAAATPFIASYYPDFTLLTPVLLALLAVELFKAFNNVQEAVLQRNLLFGRIALANVVSSLAMTLVAPPMAWLGYGVWALVAEQGVGQIARVAVVWVYKRVWTPRFGWDWATARHLWHFGATVWIANGASMLNDKFDDFWIGRTLGAGPLGIYAAAYDFAGYPTRVIANPILTVFYSTFSRLQDNRQALSQAFFRAISLIVRAGFFFSLLFVLPAPEIIGLFSAEWQPMIPVFQLMIIYTLLDPLLVATGNLLIACGRPERYTRVRMLQMICFVPAVIILARAYGVIGVAIAADLSVAIGTLLLLVSSKQFVDFSPVRLFLWPTVATSLTLLVAWLTTFSLSSTVLTIVFKVAIIGMVYGGVLLLTERHILLVNFQLIIDNIKRKK